VWLGESLKLAVLASRMSWVAKRFFGVPEFHYYAPADGISVLLSRSAVWCPLCRPSPTRLPQTDNVPSPLPKNWRKSKRIDDGPLTC
jgi:hypothetical protein